MLLQRLHSLHRRHGLPAQTRGVKWKGEWQIQAERPFTEGRDPLRPLSPPGGYVIGSESKNRLLYLQYLSSDKRPGLDKL